MNTNNSKSLDGSLRGNRASGVRIASGAPINKALKTLYFTVFQGFLIEK